jgi:hypothetical protein
MMNRFVLCVLLALSSTAVFAQLGGLGGVLGGIGGSSSSSAGSVSPERIVNGYVKGQGYVLTGEQYMIRALGLKTEEAKMVLEAKALTGTPTKSEVDQSKTVVESGNHALSEGMKTHAGQMSEASKKEFHKGTVSLAKGLQEYVAMSNDVRNYRPSVSNMDRSAVAASAIAPSLPGSISSLSSTLKAATQFMKDNDMPPLEQNATAGLPGF